MSTRSSEATKCPTPDELEAIRERNVKHTPVAGPWDRGQLLAYVDFLRAQVDGFMANEQRLINDLDAAHRALAEAKRESGATETASAG